MNTENVVAEMTSAKNEYNMALGRGSGVANAKERMKNIAFNYFDYLLEAVKKNQSLQEEIDALDKALAETDGELKELKETKTAAKKKPANSKAIVLG